MSKRCVKSSPDVRCPVVEGRNMTSSLGGSAALPIGGLYELEAMAWWLFYHKLEESKALHEVSVCYKNLFKENGSNDGSTFESNNIRPMTSKSECFEDTGGHKEGQQEGQTQV